MSTRQDRIPDPLAGYSPDWREKQQEDPLAGYSAGWREQLAPEPTPEPEAPPTGRIPERELTLSQFGDLRDFARRRYEATRPDVERDIHTSEEPIRIPRERLAQGAERFGTQPVDVARPTTVAEPVEAPGRVLSPLEKREAGVPDVGVRRPTLAESGPTGEAQAGLVRGTGQIARGAGGAVRALDELIPGDLASQKTAGLVRFGSQLMSDPRYARSPESGGGDRPAVLNPRWWIAGLSEIAPQYAVQLGLGIVSGPVAFALPTLALEGGGAMLDAEANLVAQGLDPKDARRQAATEALLTGVGASIFEALPATALFGKVPGLDRAFMQSFARRAALRGGVNALAEGATEIAQEAWGDAVSVMLESNPDAFLNATGRYASAGLLGAAAGGIAGAVTPRPGDEGTGRVRDRLAGLGGPDPAAVQERLRQVADIRDPDLARPWWEPAAGDVGAGEARGETAAEPQAGTAPPAVDQPTAPASLPPISDIEKRQVVNAMADFTHWMRTIQTPGAEVRHLDEGWTGRIVRPARRGRSGEEMVLVEHPGVRDDDPETVQRFYRIEKVEPATPAPARDREQAAGAAREVESSVTPETPVGVETPEVSEPVTTEAPGPGFEGRVPREALDLDPQRFQYKVTGKAAQSRALEEAPVFNRALAGVITAWRDPADGRLKVVNGHNRVSRGDQLGETSHLVRVIDAPDAASARATGALINIAEGQGTSIDAGKFFRDSGMSPADLEQQGIVLSGERAREGLALSRLAPKLFDDVVARRLPVKRAVLIGESGMSEAQQLELTRALEKRGERLRDDEVAQLIRQVQGAGETVETQETLFGTETFTRSLFVERARLAAAVERELAERGRGARAVSRSGRAERLEAEGIGAVDVERARQVAQEAGEDVELFNRLSTRAGPVSQALQRAAERLAKGEKQSAIETGLIEEISAALETERESLPGREGRGAPGTPDADREGVRAGEADAAAEEAFVDPDQEALFDRQPDLFGEESGAQETRQESLFGAPSLAEQESAARETITRLRPILEAGRATAEQRDRYREALALVRRAQAQSEEEVRLRAKGEAPPEAPEQGAFFDVAPGDRRAQRDAADRLADQFGSRTLPDRWPFPENPYAILGLDPDTASLAEAREAFIRMAKTHHPDAGGSTEAMARITAAYQWIKKNPEAARRTGMRGYGPAPGQPPGTATQPEPAGPTTATAEPPPPPRHGAIEVGGTTFHPIAPVEIARIATELMGEGSIFVKKYPSSRGMFRADPMMPEIGLNPELGKDYEQFAQTLAHEVGHLIDFMSDRTLSRGNILGRLAVLKGYLAETIDRLPSDPSKALTPDDRKRIRRAAEKKVGPRAGRTEFAWRQEIANTYREMIQEEIEARDLIERERVHEELIGVSAAWRGPWDFGANTSYANYRESSPELYADALSVFLNDPAFLFATAPTFFESFAAYMHRKPDVKLTYDAIQLLIGDGEDALLEARREEIERDFERGEEIQREAAQKEDPQSVRSYLKQLFVDRASPVTDVESRRVGKVPAHSEKRALRMALQEHQHADNVNRLMLMDIEREVHAPMAQAEITPEQAGRMLMLQRIAEGDRGGMAEQAKAAIMEATGRSEWEAARAAYTEEALGEDFDADLLELAETGILNPRGYTPEEAARTLEGLRKELGDERYGLLDTLMARFREILHTPVEQAVALGSYNLQVYQDTILPNRKTYAPFAVLDYFNGRVPAGVKRQIGTVKGIANPYTTAMLKAMALNRLNEFQRVKLQILKVLDTDFPDMAGPVKPIDKFHREQKPKPGRENLLYLRDGKLFYREVDAYIAKVLEQADIGSLGRITRALSSGTYSLFHPLYVTWSLAWQARNIQRDWKRTFKNLAASHAGKPTYRQAIDSALDIVRLNRAYVRTMGAAWRHARRQHDPLIRAMLKDRALGRAFHSFEPNIEDKSYDRLLQQYGLQEPRGSGAKEKIRKLGRAIETFGVFQETWSKAAAFELLTDMGVSPKERAYIVRNYTGTPDSAQRGLASDAVNGVVLYANVIMAGLRADAEVALQPSTAAGYWMRSFVTDFLPKAAMAAALVGFFDDEMEEWFQHIPSYDLEKYIVVPIPPFWSVNEQGERKAIYFRMPHDDLNRVLAGALWALLLNDGPHRVARTFGLVSGEFGGVNPGLTLPWAWYQVARGKNPEDTFRGRPIVPQTEWDAGGWARWKALIRHTLGEFGIASDLMGGFIYGRPDESQTTLAERVLRSIPGISSLVKVSDRGLDERRWWELDREGQARAKLRADLPRSVRRTLSERYRLNRMGVDRLTETEQARRLDLNAWYRDYLEAMEAMEQARATGDTGGYDRVRAWIEEQTNALNQ